MHLRDGLIWELPIFGIFSPMLDAMVPGLGKNRAREAAGTFTITNGVAYSDDFEVKASTLRLQYRGTVDYEQRVNAKVEAEMFRDAWLVGKAVSLVLSPLTKVFEYRVTGSLQHPNMQPVFIPKFLLLPLRPFHTIKSLIPDRSVPDPTLQPQ